MLLVPKWFWRWKIGGVADVGIPCTHTVIDVGEYLPWMGCER
jgi:hypothetical protein